MEPAHDDGKRRAATAIVLCDSDVLLMQRAVREGDPWSGHISLPGGGYQRGDGSLRAAAMRETIEELGVDLAGARHLGQLTPVRPFSGLFELEITAFVFVVDARPAVTLGPEAVGSFWLPLARVATGEFDGEYHYEPRDMRFPCWNYEGHVIWGLTWRLLGDLIKHASD